MPRLVKSGAIFWGKRVNEPFENVFVRTPPIPGAPNPKTMLSESKKLLFGDVLSKVVCRYLVPRLVKSGKTPPPPPPGAIFLKKTGK